MDKRAGNKGTKGNKGGRPPKAIEQQLLEKLQPMEEEALKQLHESIKKGHNWALRLYFEYAYGKAKEFKEIEVTEVKRKIGYGEIDED